MNIAKHLKIRGLVQGVYYRESFKAEAIHLQLTGWIRNRKDGSVEAFVQGNLLALDKIEAWARQGPPRAKVESIEVKEASWDSSCISFTRLPTE
jgi:acylphosphatase